MCEPLHLVNVTFSDLWTVKKRSVPFKNVVSTNGSIRILIFSKNTTSRYLHVYYFNCTVLNVNFIIKVPVPVHQNIITTSICSIFEQFGFLSLLSEA